jgi:hypothetical protein
MKATPQYTFSMRDQLIIAQALVLGIQELEKVPAPFTEVSNILDMKDLLNGPFNQFAQVAELMAGESDRINTQYEVN